jgi:hypothetical protein
MEGAMAQLKYRLHREGDGFSWELRAEDGAVLVKGFETSAIKARVAAMLAAVRETEQRQRISTDSDQ